MQAFSISEDVAKVFVELNMKRAHRYLIIAISEDGS